MAFEAEAKKLEEVLNKVESDHIVGWIHDLAMPDPTFGERVCVFVELKPGARALSLDQLRAHLEDSGVGKETWPEHLIVLPELPRASGGKVAKGELRAEIERRVEAGERAGH